MRALALGRRGKETSDAALKGGAWNGKHMAAPSYWRKSLRRCVGRSNNNANADGGLVYAVAFDVSSHSYSSYGVRLAFTGELENESEIDPTQSEAA